MGRFTRRHTGFNQPIQKKYHCIRKEQPRDQVPSLTPDWWGGQSPLVCSDHPPKGSVPAPLAWCWWRCEWPVKLSAAWCRAGLFRAFPEVQRGPDVSSEPSPWKKREKDRKQVKRRIHSTESVGPIVKDIGNRSCPWEFIKDQNPEVHSRFFFVVQSRCFLRRFYSRDVCVATSLYFAKRSCNVLQLDLSVARAIWHLLLLHVHKLKYPAGYV